MLHPRSVLACVVYLSAPSASAQTVSGTVSDHQTGWQIEFARVTMMNADSTVVASALSNFDGFFAIEGTPGEWKIRVERLGYATHATKVTIREGENVAITVKMSAEGLPLQPIEVNLRRGFKFEAGHEGFTRRMALGKGVFLNADSISLRKPVMASEAFYGIPLINVSFDGRLSTWKGGKCVKVYVDHKNIPLNEERTFVTLDQLIGVKTIMGIEVYRDMSEVPVELRTSTFMADLWSYTLDPLKPAGRGRDGSQPCGMVWIWTNAAW
jgi:hypothetical protein